MPRPLRLPTGDEVDALEARFGPFHPDFRRYLLEGSNVVFGTKEPVTAATPADGALGYTYLPKVVENARAYGVPNDLIPICEDNADFFCVTPTGEVVFWSHNGETDESWPSVADWIESVWIEEL